MFEMEPANLQQSFVVIECVASPFEVQRHERGLCEHY